ncbi:uncharacterized protein LOC110461581 [Mizuhopecten yessoensis]|uniref:uncharacterized protein LOC110461581 n=1 Tax=Mizuhopecten yessoensis TaxID=6573 RepID=UPI000B45BB23|nr:uncharacterized protein LOC110461581 [Mizuhopecten yessoensis]
MFSKTVVSVAFLLTSVFFLAVTARPILDGTLLNITARRGSTVKLPCNIQNLGTHKVAWFDGGETVIAVMDRIIYDISRYNIERLSVNDWSLVIRHVGPTDEGIYRCRVDTQPILVKPIQLIVDGRVAGGIRVCIPQVVDRLLRHVRCCRNQ